MTDALDLDPKTTTFLFMDFQNGIVSMLGEAGAAVVARASPVLAAARAAGASVVFVRVAFRAGYPEVSPRNKSFSALKASGRFVLGAPDAEVVEALAPRPDEPVVIKHRVGALGGTDLDPILRGRGAETLVLLGISTSGVILSTLRRAADEDYRIVVVEDGCADPDAEVHRVLTGKVFPRQATVTRADAVLAALAKGG